MSSPQEEEVFVLASTYLDDAIHCRNINFVPEREETRSYRLYKSRPLTALVYVAVVAICLLALFERPALNRLSLPFWITVTVELLCVAFFLFRFLHELTFTRREGFWRDAKHVVAMAIILLTVFDIAVSTVLHEVGLQYYRWSRPLRPFILVNLPEGRQIRQGFRNIRRTLPDILNVLFLFFANVALFALMAFKLFGGEKFKRENSDGGTSNVGYFDSFPNSFWQLYVLVTTANSPDVMIPAYERSKWSSIFFIVYLVLNLYIFMSVFLAVVYNQFKENLKKEVRENVERRTMLLDKVYELVRCEHLDGISKENFFRLMEATHQRSGAAFRDYVGVLWFVLDPKEAGSISRDAFKSLLELLSLPYCDIYRDSVIFDSWFPSFYRSTASKRAISLIKHKYFRNIFDLAILANAIFIAFDLDGGENVFLTIFTLEIALKLYAFGIRAFFRKMWNVFDVVVVGSAITVSILRAAIGQDISREVLDFILILRVTRIFKVFHAIPRFRTVLNTLVDILPSLLTYGSIVFVVYYFFAIIGMELFQDLIRDVETSSSGPCGNIRLKDSDFHTARYCSSNFNNLVSSFVVLFELMVVNQWHVIADGYVLVTGTEWTKLYFLSFHIVTVTCILNIFIAFVLEAFILEYTLANVRIRSNLLAEINGLGLLISSPTRKEEGPIKDEQNPEHNTYFANGTADADHDNWWEEEGGGDDGDPQNSASMEKGIRDYSNRTSIRFYLRRRAASIQELLEKMFERQV